MSRFARENPEDDDAYERLIDAADFQRKADRENGINRANGARPASQASVPSSENAETPTDPRRAPSSNGPTTDKGVMEL